MDATSGSLAEGAVDSVKSKTEQASEQAIGTVDGAAQKGTDSVGDVTGKGTESVGGADSKAKDAQALVSGFKSENGGGSINAGGIEINVQTTAEGMSLTIKIPGSFQQQ
jgi:hypothetical protein